MQPVLFNRSATRFRFMVALAILIILALSAGVLLLHGRAAAAGGSAKVIAQMDTVPNSPESALVKCNIANIAVFSTRIHVFCNLPAGTAITYFATSTVGNNGPHADRILTILNTAYALGKPVYLYYLDDPANNPNGCLAKDCRAIDWLFIVP